MRSARLVVCTLVVVLVGAAMPAFGGITIDELTLVGGRLALVLGDRMFVPGNDGVFRLARDGNYALPNGQRVVVKRRRFNRPPWALKLFDPQPEPPGNSLVGVLVGGEEVMLTGGKLFFVFGRARRLCPDGNYRLKGGARARVRGGQVVELSSLEGFTLGADTAARAGAR